MSLILSIYDHSVMTYIKFHEEGISLEELLPFDRPNTNEFVHSEP